MLTERPLISKRDILTVLDPTGNAKDSAFRRLKRDGFISGGVEVKPRHEGHAHGTLVMFCALNRDAATAYRKGSPELARRIAAKARKIESSKAARQMVELAGLEIGDKDDRFDLDSVYRRVADLDRRPADELARQVEAARASWEKAFREMRVMTIHGTVKCVDKEAAEIDSPDGQRYAFPLHLTNNYDIALKAALSVRFEQLGDGSFWTLVGPAWSDASEEENQGDPFGDLRPALPENLDRMLDTAQPRRPLALIGPHLAWR
jgi:hypothetical protein